VRRKWLRTTTEIVGFVKDWEIIADNLSKAGWSWGCVSAIDSSARTIWIADAHCDDGKRVVASAGRRESVAGARYRYGFGDTWQFAW
jgi:hypothetical protein